MRRSYTLRFLFLTATCAVIIVGLHFYMYIYNKRSSQDNSGQIVVEKHQPSSFRLFEERFSKTDQVSSQEGQETEWKHDPRVNLQHKIVHLDLKGMPLTVKAFESLFPLLAKAGATGVLMEYEDMFPYEGKLELISNKEAYSREDITRILELAESSNLKVIPLIQTFGHLEFVLKLSEFEKLREVPKYMQVICPTNNDSVIVLKDMVNQVMALHPKIEYFHIGSDEVYHIGQCPLCTGLMNKFGIDESQLFLRHVSFIAEYVKNKHKVQPLMWDDEFRKLDEASIQKSGIGNLVEIVVWNYNPDIENHLPRSMWEKYSRIFKSVWVGSAFKGANKPNSAIVNETLYLGNHYAWLRTMQEFEKLLTFKGIILTGWQRYDHFSGFCELLPSAIPSLAACMTLLTEPKIHPMSKILMDVSLKLHCANFLNICKFPGSMLHQEIIQLEYYRESFKKLKEKHVFLGWAQESNLRHRFSSPSHIEPIFQEINSIKDDLDRSRVTLVQALQELYPQWSVDEWMSSRFEPFYNKIQHIHTGLTNILEMNTFPRRPLENQVQDL